MEEAKAKARRESRLQIASVANNVKGGTYIRFKLVRGTNQPDVDLSRLYQAEKDVFDRPKNSI